VHLRQQLPRRRHSCQLLLVHGRQLLLLLQVEQVLVLQLQLLLLLHLRRAHQGLHCLLLRAGGLRLLPRGMQLLQRHLQLARGGMARRVLHARGAVALLLLLLLLLLVVWAALSLAVATTAACLWQEWTVGSSSRASA
jgi:hypothetical protein